MELSLVAAAAGITVMLVALLMHRTEQDRAIDRLVGMSPARSEPEEGDDASRVVARAVELAAQVVARVDSRGSLSQALNRAHVPLRPGEFVIIDMGAGLAAAAVTLAATHAPLLAAVCGAGAPALGLALIRRRERKRKRAFEAQLPDALSLIASSLSAGHTFLRAIQMMCEEAGPPLSEEFAQVVAETRLGDSVVDSIERMAERLRLRDMDMVVQAIRIQQTVGGRLADLLHTLADFIRARDEVRREVKVLTAEGRMSAYVLTGLVPFLFGVIQFLNPEYVTPLYHGWGIAILVYCGGSVLAGLVFILRMVKIDF